MASAKADSRWTLGSTGNRIMWAVIAAVAVFALSRNVFAGAIVGLALYAALTLTVIATRRR